MNDGLVPMPYLSPLLLTHTRANLNSKPVLVATSYVKGMSLHKRRRVHMLMVHQLTAILNSARYPLMAPSLVTRV